MLSVFITKLLKLRALNRFNICSFICASKMHVGVISLNEHKRDFLQSISLDDRRMKKYLKTLSDQYLDLQNKKKSGSKLITSDLEISHKLESFYVTFQKLDNIQNELKELNILLSELGNQDELKSTALDEKKELELKLDACKFDLIGCITEEDVEDDKDIIMELQSGVGGQEAMLFTKDMVEMYNNYFLYKRWNCELLKLDATDIGGVKLAHFSVSGPNAYKFLKFESGVHRVQRVPKTEKAGRMHTSTMTVAVLPQPTEIDVVLNKKDLDFTYMRSSAPGGQNVNKTDSCVRLTHIPTGIVCECQVERDQHKNKELALKSLRAKLYEKELNSIVNEAQLNRKLQVGCAGRSEKVRTYNFTQRRITDHRAHIQIHDIENFFQGTEVLDNFLEKLQAWSTVQILMETLNKYDST